MAAAPGGTLSCCRTMHSIVPGESCEGFHSFGSVSDSPAAMALGSTVRRTTQWPGPMDAKLVRQSSCAHTDGRTLALLLPALDVCPCMELVLPRGGAKWRSAFEGALRTTGSTPSTLPRDRDCLRGGSTTELRGRSFGCSFGCSFTGSLGGSLTGSFNCSLRCNSFSAAALRSASCRSASCRSTSCLLACSRSNSCSSSASRRTPA
mmetsp:Transcript_4009/g.11614  ORF Transcript_4009/g.11614 Transcript_4009/m.11614 type:complete len:206 (+) Transcript_4009:189-806(+)